MTNKSVSKTIVYYDVTRLISRRFAPFATGIDRIDVYYLDQFLANIHVKCVFVTKSKCKTAIIPYAFFIKFFYELKNIWFGTQKVFSQKLNFKIEALGFASVCYGFKNSPHKIIKWASRMTFTAWGSIMRKRFSIRKLPKCGGVYFTASHQGLAKSMPNQLEAFVKHTNCCVEAYIHDIIPITHPEYTRSESAVEFFKVFINNILKEEPNVIYNSHFTKTEFEAYANKNEFEISDVKIEYPKISSIISQQVKEPIKKLGMENYFIYISTIDPRKNHLLLLKIWQKMVQENVRNIPKLYIIGKRGWNNKEVFKMLDECEQIKPYVFEYNDMDDLDANYLLMHATALLFPSFVEGYGMPLLEANQAGTPIIASDIDIFRELKQQSLKKLTLIELNNQNAWYRTILEKSCKVG